MKYVLLILFSINIFALNIDDVIKMSKNKQSESEIIQKIKTDKEIINITESDIKKLKDANISDTIINELKNKTNTQHNQTTQNPQNSNLIYFIIVAPLLNLIVLLYLMVYTKFKNNTITFLVFVSSLIVSQPIFFLIKPQNGITGGSIIFSIIYTLIFYSYIKGKRCPHCHSMKTKKVGRQQVGQQQYLKKGYNWAKDRQKSVTIYEVTMQCNDCDGSWIYEQKVTSTIKIYN